MSLLALCIGFFMVIIDATIVNVALPSISHGLQGNIAALQWVIAGYALTFACFLLSAGNLADKIGAKTAYLSGLGLFVLTSLFCSLSSTLIALIIFRLFQGISAALLVPTSLALINLSYPDKKARDKAIGIWAAVGGIAAALGPLLGGVLTATFSWRAVFFVNIPIGILSILLTVIYISKKNIININQKNNKNFDFLAQLLGIISIAALAYVLIQSGKSGFLLSYSNIMICIIFIVSLTGFIFIESRAAHPMLPLIFFKSQKFSAAIIIGMILNIGFYGELFILPLYFQEIRNYSILITGLAILPLPGFVAIASYISGRISSITGPRLPMIIGLTIGGLGFLLLIMIRATAPEYIILILPLAMIGFGTAFTMPAATIAAISALPENRAGIASGVLNASRQIGSLIGVAIFGAIINASNNFISGMHITLIIGGMLFLCAAVISFVFVKK